MSIEAGLYIASTPIGNLGDITQRALVVLKETDIIVCEDTRRTGMLLKHFGIENRLISFNEYNKQRRTPLILDLLAQGKAVALVSDAGTPGISDPGFYLIRAAIEKGYRVTPVPGASAVLAGLVVSGLPSDRFAFEGFLPKRTGRRKKRLLALVKEPRTMVFCESAVRLRRLLSEVLGILGDRRAVVCRELTKKFEEIIRGRISELLAVLATRAVKGEVVVVVAGYEERNEREGEKGS